MHRTLKEIRAEIDNKLAQEPALQELNSTSQTSLISIVADIFAFAAWTLEQMHRFFKKEVEDKLRTPSHNARWYYGETLKYQHGHELVWLEHAQCFGYLTSDTKSLIIKKAAATEIKGGVLIKVVKSKGDNLQPLTVEEFTSFSSYMDKIKDAGVDLIVRSWLPDELFVSYNIFYDPLILNSEGKLLSDNSREPVREAMLNYIETLPFNGRFKISAFEDAIQNATGVVDLQRINVKTKYGTYDFTEVIVSCIAESGYMVLTDNSMLNYKANYDV